MKLELIIQSEVSQKEKHPGLVSFRMDWLDCLAVQGTLKSLLQHHSSKASVLQHLLTKTNKNTSTYGTIIMENEIGKRDPIQPKL